MADFLLELFSEEIPARMQGAAAVQLKAAFEALLADAGLRAETVEAHATPRRLALIARGVPVASEATSEERRGPKVDAPGAAVEGFLKSTGLTRCALEERDTGKGVFLFAVIGRAGRPAGEILAEKLPGLIAGFSWPKSQRWGAASVSTASARWVRPLRGIVALLDGEVVPFEALGVASGRATFGHRFMGDGGPISVKSVATYAQQLADAFVVLSADARRELVRAGALKAAEAAGLRLRLDEGLEAENAGLTEWPVPLLGRFDPAFLEVPPEIIQLTMRTNQKYFAVEDADGALAPAFVCVANLVAADGGKTIVAGNERVLSARLSDARFFWEQDRKVRLEQHAEKLGSIVFHEKLGTVADKVERVAKLARRLVESGAVPGADADLVERAARLAKADLTTGTVGEFPELQGVIGGYLAAAQGERPEVVEGLKQFYAPVPKGAVPAAVALADRAHTIAAFFDADIYPTGSKDPFALRRAMLGVINIIRNSSYRFSAMSLFQNAENYELIREFLQDRLRVQALDEGVWGSCIEATLFWRGDDDIVRVVARAKALQSFLGTTAGINVLAGYRRAANILRNEEKKDGRVYALDASVPLSKYIGETEKTLAAFFVPAEGSNSTLFFDEADALFAAEDFVGAMRNLASLRAPVDAFFEGVTVNDPDPEVRARRLGLLAAIREAMHRVADFSRIEGA